MRHIALIIIAAPLCAAHPPESGTTHFSHAEHWSHHIEAPADGLTITHAITLGQADHRYESVPNWCSLEGPLGSTHGGLVVDRDGFIYTNTDTERSIMVFSPEGKLVRTFAKDFVGIHHMLIVDEHAEGADKPAQFLYAVHLAGDALLKFTLEGELLWSLGTPIESGKYDDNHSAYNPTSVAVAPNGEIYIADGYGRNWIHQFRPDRTYVRSFGGPGSADGQFQTCHGVAVDTRGPEPRLIVCDREGRRLQRFTLDGTFVDVVATDLRRPCAIAFWGDLMGVAELEGRVVLLDKTYAIVSTLGDNPDRSQWANHGVAPDAWKPGIFTAPHSMNFDRQGNIYVQDWNASGRISKLRRLPAPAAD